MKSSNQSNHNHRSLTWDHIEPWAEPIDGAALLSELRDTFRHEADAFLQGNDEMRGILNAGYSRETAYVVRVSNEIRPFGVPPSGRSPDPRRRRGNNPSPEKGPV